MFFVVFNTTLKMFWELRPQGVSSSFTQQNLPKQSLSHVISDARACKMCLHTREENKRPYLNLVAHKLGMGLSGSQTSKSKF